MSDWSRIEAVMARDYPALPAEEQSRRAVELVQRASACNLSMRALLFVLEHGFTVREVLRRISAIEAFTAARQGR